jgi:hypothetical protein
MAQRIRVETNRAPAGKMSFSEFSAALTEAMNKGDTHPIPQIAKAAQFMRKEVYAPVLQAAQDAADEWGSKRLFTEIQFDQNHSYMTHHYSPARVAADQTGFIRTVSDYVLGATRANWERKIEKVRRKAAADLTAADLLNLDKETAQRLFDENAAVLEQMKEAADPRIVRIKELRTEVRDLTTDKLEELEEGLERDPLFSVTRAESVEGQSRVRIAGMSPQEMRKLARELVDERRQQLLDEIAEIEAGLPRDVLAGVPEGGEADG